MNNSPLPSLQERESTLFARALEKSVAERAAFLQAVCGKDSALRQRLEALLAAHDQPDELLGDAAGKPTIQATMKIEYVDEPADEAVGQTLGRYKLLERVGEGGCGVVYVAEQTEPVRRRVALKVIKLGMDTKQVVARFEAERQALAMMDHPNIAKVLDAGTTEVGRPYFVMELVRGIRITDYCDQANLTTKERLDLFIKVCQAIQHAHQKGIIHRDIKPSNILVTLHDGVPVAKVIDFGIAKATEGRLTDNTVYTQLHQFIGTPAYMSPEQAEMSGLDIDTRSDIYSLGVLLYELLAGSTPFDAKELMASGIDAMRKTIREKEPVRPSTKLSQTLGAIDKVGRVAPRAPSSGEATSTSGARGATRPTTQSEEEVRASSRRLLRVKETITLLKGDLDWIVMKCLEKDRTRRYETANGLTADLKRHLNNEPVVARPPTAGYRFQKAYRRNKLAFTAAAAVAIALVAGIGVSTWQAVEASRARNAEMNQRLTAQAAQERAVREQKRAEQAAQDLRRHVYVADMNVAHEALAENNLWLGSKLVRKHFPKPGEEDLRGFEWRYLWQRCQGDDFFTLREHNDILTCAVFSPDGRVLATAGFDQTVKIFDLASHKVLATIEGFAHYVARNSLAFSPDGRLLAAADGQHITLWDTAQWRRPRQKLECRVLEGAGVLTIPLVFSPDGRTLATKEGSGSLRCWDTTTWQTKTILTGKVQNLGAVLAYSTDGKTLAIGTDNQIELWDLQSESQIVGSPIFLPEPGCLKFSARENVLAVGNYDGDVILWDFHAGRMIQRWKPNKFLAWGMDISPDGKTLATGGGDQLIHLWDIATQKKLATLQGHVNEIWALAFSLDGRTLASASKDGTAKLWSTSFKPAEIELANSFEPKWFSTDGRTLMTFDEGLDLQVWDVAGREMLRQFKIPATNVSKPLYWGAYPVSPDGRTQAYSLTNGTVEIWNLESFQRTATISVGGAMSPTAFSPDGRLLAVRDRTLATTVLWDIVSSQEIARFTNTSGALGFSPDGTILACGGPDYAVKLWSLSTKKELATLRGHKWIVYQLAFSPDGKLLVSGAIDNTALIWDVAAKRKLAVLQGHKSGVHSLAFSPDGKTIATGSTDETVKLWNAATGQQLMTLREFKADLGSLQFSPDGTTLAAGRATLNAPHRTVQLWRAPSFREIEVAEAKANVEVKDP